MLNQILVPLDGSDFAECVLPHVTAMARAFNAQVHLIQITEQISLTEPTATVDPLTWRLRKTEADLYLNSIKERLENKGLAVEKALLEGHAVDQIARFIEDKSADLMILGSHGHQEHGFSDWNMSFAVQQILRRHLMSTLIVRCTEGAATETDELQYRRLLVPLDGSRRAESVLPIATTLAQEHDAELLLVHVVVKPEMARRMPLNQEDQELLSRFVSRNAEEGRLYLEQLHAHLRGNIRTLLQTSDDVPTTLQDITEREQVDLMVLTAHGYSGNPRWAYGSVTNRFIADGTIPLLIIQDLPVDTFQPVPVEAATRLPGQR